MQLAEFGDDHLACILDHFRSVLEQNGVDLPAAEVEWTELKEVQYSRYVHCTRIKDINYRTSELYKSAIIVEEIKYILCFELHKCYFQLQSSHS